jgi:site-specific DNA recombinase
MMRIYTYARFSTDRQDEASITDQQRVCHEFATRRDWGITANFVDEGISGAALGNRPGVQRLLATLEPRDILLLADLTRLCRSQDLAPLLERLRFRSIRVLGVLDGFDIDSPHARMQAGLSGLMSDEMRAQLRVRTHLALETRAKTSRPTGGRAFGFDNTGQPVDPDAQVIVEVFGRFAAGETLRSIATDLNVRGIPSPGAKWARSTRRRDGRWLVSALHEILHNERYIGRVVWNRSTWIKDPDSGKRIRRERPSSEWVVTTGPRLIDEVTWLRTEAIEGTS